MSGQRSLARSSRACRNPTQVRKRRGRKKSSAASAISTQERRASSHRRRLTRARGRAHRSLLVKIEYSEEAAADLAEATGWYRSSRIGFDEVFLAAVLRAETLISDHPLAAP